MRDSLTVIALALIVVLTTALVGPYLIDWSGQRTWIEGELTRTLGAETRIAGRIDLKLLPSPYFLVEKIAVGGENEKTPRLWSLTAKKLRLEIALAPLLHGEVDFVEARLDSPRLALTLGQSGALAPRSEGTFGRRLRFERIEVSNGTLHVVDPTRNRAFDLNGIALKAEAVSLFGPFKGQGAADFEGQRTPFRFATGVVEKGAMKLKFSTTARASLPAVALDGSVSFGSEAPNFAGSAKFESADPAWRVSGQLTLDRNRAALAAIDAHAGGDDHGLSATGQAELDYSAEPKASLTFASDALDLDAWRAAGGEDPRLALARLGASPLPLVLSYNAKAVTFGEATFTDLAANLVSGAPQTPQVDNRAAPAWLRFEGRGPQKSRLFLDGQWRMGADPGFSGRLQANMQETGWLKSWLRFLAPSWSPEWLAFRAADVSASVRLSAKAIKLDDLALRLDGSRFTGALDYRPGSGAQPSWFSADLVTPSLDLAIPALDLRGIWSKAFSSCDGSLRLEALALQFGEVHSLGGLDFHLTKTHDEIALDEFTYEGLDGTIATASGQVSNKTAHLDARILAPREGKLAAALAKMAENPATDLLLSRAGALTPINLSLTADAAQTDFGLRRHRLFRDGRLWRDQCEGGGRGRSGALRRHVVLSGRRRQE